jgi:hypothetical protein
MLLDLVHFTEMTNALTAKWIFPVPSAAPRKRIFSRILMFICLTVPLSHAVRSVILSEFRSVCQAVSYSSQRPLKQHKRADIQRPVWFVSAKSSVSDGYVACTFNVQRACAPCNHGVYWLMNISCVTEASPILHPVLLTVSNFSLRESTASTHIAKQNTHMTRRKGLAPSRTWPSWCSILQDPQSRQPINEPRWRAGACSL